MAVVMTALGPVRLPDNPEATGDADSGYGPNTSPPPPPPSNPVPPNFPDPGYWAKMSPGEQSAWVVNNPPKVASGSNLTKAQVRTNVKLKAWSPQQAVDYLMQVYKMDEDEAVAELTGAVATGGARGRDPGLAEGTALDNELKRRRMEQDIEDRARRDRLDERGFAIDDRNFGVSEEQRGIENAYRDAKFKYEQAKNAQDFGEAQRQFNLMQELRVAAQALSERKVGSDIALGESADRRANLGANLQRNEQAGYVVDAVGTGMEAGTLTAAEQQRRFDRARAVGQDAQGMYERERAARQNALEFQAQLAERQQQTQNMDVDRQDRNRQFEAQLQIASANRQRPRVFTPGLVQSRVGGGY